jgi:LacI family transcriptional regulator
MARQITHVAGLTPLARLEPLPTRGKEDAVTTIARVAALAGVGVGTVSRVLNDSGAVSASTRRRVEEAIETLGYEPSAAARALSTGRTMAIGVVAPFLTQPSVVERLRGMARRAADAGYRLLLLDVERPDAVFDTVGAFAVHGRVDGLLVISLPLPEDVRASSVTTVLVDRPSDGLPSVHIDDEAGGRLATEHLLDLGHTRIGFIGDLEDNAFGFDSSASRRRGYEAALRDAGLVVDDALVRTAPHGRDEARAMASELLALPAPPSAIFAASDDQALGVLEAAEALGVPVPEQLSVVGFDDIEVARYVNLTTIAQPLETSGARGVELLLDALAGGTPRSEQLDCELVVRGTTAATHGPETANEREGKPRVRTPLLNGMMRSSRTTGGGTR